VTPAQCFIPKRICLRKESIGGVNGGPNSKDPKVAITSHLIGDLHEWCNDSYTVSSTIPAKLNSSCRCEVVKEGREDPDQLYCKRVLNNV